MKKIIILFVLLLSSNISYAGSYKLNQIDCNENISKITHKYICSNEDLKDLNNLFNRHIIFSDNKYDITKNDNIIYEMEVQIYKNKKEGIDNQAIIDELEALKKNKYEILYNLDYLSNWKKEQILQLDTCKNKQCIVDNYNSILKKLNDYKDEKHVVYDIDKECDVFVLNRLNQKTKSDDIFVSNDTINFKEKIKINIPNKCSYLVLSAPSPTIWDIYSTKESDIKKIIIIGGKYKHIARGYPNDVKIFNNSGNLPYKKKSLALSEVSSDDDLKQELIKKGFNDENIKFTNTNIIGENTEDFNYIFDEETISDEIPKDILPPEKDGWKKLISEGKVRKTTKSDFKKFEEIGLINIDNNNFFWDIEQYQFLLKDSNHIKTNSYILLEEIEEIPDLSSTGVFIPNNIKFPKNLNTKETFVMPFEEGVNMFNKIYLIRATSEEIKTW